MGIAESDAGGAGIRFVRLKDLPQVELYHAARRTQANPRHVHSVFSLTVSEGGVGIHRTRQGAFPMTPGCLAVVNCGDAHSGDVPPGAFSSTRTIRLQKATDLLAAGVACAEAALESGFCDQSHFCRAFKKKFGITPAQYQR